MDICADSFSVLAVVGVVQFDPPTVTVGVRNLEVPMLVAEKGLIEDGFGPRIDLAVAARTTRHVAAPEVLKPELAASEVIADDDGSGAWDGVGASLIG